jgi:hypothetical protein
MSYVIFKERLPATVPTPYTNRAHLFVNSATDKLTLRLDDGSLLVIGGGLEATDTTFVTASLANNTEENATVTLGKVFTPIRVTVDAACRLRLYQNAAARTADNSRVPGTSPTGEHGLILELRLTTTTGLVWDIVNPPTGYNGETVPTGDIPYCIKNESGGTATITVTIRHLVIQE